MTNNISKPVRHHWLRWLLLLLLCVVIGGVVWRVWFSAGGGAGPGGHGFGGPTLVNAGQAGEADVPVYLSAPGTVIPNASVTVTSRVEGQLDKVFFTEGQRVSAGQLLA